LYTKYIVQRTEDLLLGKLAVRERLCTQDQVDECLRIQSMTRSDAQLGDLLLFKGYLTAEQLKDLLGRQNKKLMRCAACGLSFTVVTLSDGKSARCPRCKGPLEAAQPGEPTRTDAEFSTTTIPKGVPVDGPRLYFVCVICDHKFEGTRDPSGRAKCPACQSTFSAR
jgi:rubrerythrin